MESSPPTISTPELVSSPPAGFADFFEREALGQVRRATLLLGSVDEANDVVQEAMVRVYQRWDRVDDPGPYLNRTVLNLCRDRGRRGARRIRALTELAARPGPEANPGPADPPGARLLDDVLTDLPFNHRAAVVLKYWGGLSTAEIARELGCSPNSVGPWITRALTRMREVLT